MLQIHLVYLYKAQVLLKGTRHGVKLYRGLSTCIYKTFQGLEELRLTWSRQEGF
jgi:hypothetical protein